MKLQFKGLSYHHTPSYVETPASEITGQFLGSTYKMRHPLVTNPISVRHLKYRGVEY